jgi:hypothetical protein
VSKANYRIVGNQFYTYFIYVSVKVVVAEFILKGLGHLFEVVYVDVVYCSEDASFFAFGIILIRSVQPIRG